MFHPFLSDLTNLLQHSFARRWAWLAAAGVERSVWHIASPLVGPAGDRPRAGHLDCGSGSGGRFPWGRDAHRHFGDVFLGFAGH